MTISDQNSAGDALSAAAVEALTAEVTGVVLQPGQDGYAAEVATYNFAVPNAPALVVGAAGPADVQAAVRFAAAHGRPVAVLSTGHTPVVPGEGTVMITTRRMDEVTIDPHQRRARVGAGVRWQQVVDAATPHGLAPLNGSSPLVGVVGYTLGGGLSATMARAFGWASDHVRGIDVVTADGELHHADAESDADLFWAVRGSKSNLGVVTAMEFDLFPVRTLFAGALIFTGEHAEAVLSAYADLTANAPDELTTSISFMRLPPLPVFPEPLRGTFTVHVRFSFIGDSADGEKLLAPLRAAAPAIVDTVADMPYENFAAIYNDPVDPAPFAERTLALGPLQPELVHKLIATAGPEADVPANFVELRHVGGALARTPSDAGAAGIRDAEFILWVVAIGDPVGTAPAMQWSETLFDDLAPWTRAGKYLNFMAGEDLEPDAVRAAYSPDTYRRLQHTKKAYDPANLFRLNHNIAPLD
ncbi:FAD-binding oxidoreductase [Actinoplanes sp. M2I2]|uniref:FAD-binding oxidoreductase n=1 Tax=Actinoplanes sp. M2I2 TaxID=1734444 RepID=UPI0020200EE1|nr:FAD-binding oxidoreductase [Actinoplanes sp. M2I2]